MKNDAESKSCPGWVGICTWFTKRNLIRVLALYALCTFIAGCGPTSKDVLGSARSEDPEPDVRQQHVHETPSGPTVNLLLGSDLGHGATIAASSEIVDIVWDPDVNLIIILGILDGRWVIEHHSLNFKEHKVLYFQDEFLPASRIFYRGGEPCIVAGRIGDESPQLFSVQNSMMKRLDISLDSNWRSELGNSRRNDQRLKVLASVKPFMPMSGTPTIDRRGSVGSLAPLDVLWKAFPLGIGHPSKPLVAFGPKDDAFAVALNSVEVFRKFEGKWKSVLADDENGSIEGFKVGGRSISMIMDDKILVVGYAFKDDGEADYKTLHIDFSSPNSYHVKRVLGLSVSLKSEREIDPRITED